jgi:hypothetical protein
MSESVTINNNPYGSLLTIMDSDLVEPVIEVRNNGDIYLVGKKANPEVRKHLRAALLATDKVAEDRNA